MTASWCRWFGVGAQLLNGRDMKDVLQLFSLQVERVDTKNQEE